MLATEVLNWRAISPQVSPSFTVYSTGGRGVQVGSGMLVGVLAKVADGFSVMVGVAVASSVTAALRPPMIAK